VRLLIVVPAVLLGYGSGTVFLLALPLALLADLVLLVAFGAFRGICWQPADDAARLLRYYGLWGLLAWLLNADVIYARLVLSPAHAGDYAVAFTIGRQPAYAVAPLAMVLLSVTLAGHPREQRNRFWAVVGVAGLLLLATLLSFDVWPGLVLRVLAGRSSATLIGLLRGYALVGALAAAAMLLVTFVFALGSAPRLGIPGGVAILSLLAALLLVRQPWQLLTLQGAAVAALVGVYGYVGLQATRLSGPTVRSAPSARRRDDER